MPKIFFPFVAAGGGGGGDVATDAIFDAKGDLAVGTGADTAAALTVGANDTMTVAASGEATGIKWAKVVNANVDAAAAIAYSKLNLGTSIVNADINAAAAIAGSKLNFAIDDASDAVITTPQLGNRLMYNGTAWVNSGPKQLFEVFDDFTQETSTTSAPFIESNSGTGAVTTQLAITVANRPGVARSELGSTTTGRASLTTAVSSICLGQGLTVYEAPVFVTALSDGTDTFACWWGFFDTATSTNQVDACMFLYDQGGVATDGGASPNWQMYNSSNSVRTIAATSTAVATNTFQVLRIEINAGATSAQFFVDGVSVGTQTTNLPSTGVARALGAGSAGLKSAGTGNRTFGSDYMMARIAFTTPR